MTKYTTQATLVCFGWLASVVAERFLFKSCSCCLRRISSMSLRTPAGLPAAQVSSAKETSCFQSGYVSYRFTSSSTCSTTSERSPSCSCCLRRMLFTSS